MPIDRRPNLILITADHGQVDCPAEEAICLGEHPNIVDSLLLPPAGQSRAAYLYGLPRSVEQLAVEQRRWIDRRLEMLDRGNLGRGLAAEELELGVHGSSQRPEGQKKP